MGKGQKALVIGLGLLLVLFVVAVVLPRRGNDGGDRGDDPPELQDRVEALLGRWFDDPATVERRQLDAACFEPADGDRLVVEGSCTLWVVPSGAKLRLVRLHVDDPIAVSSRAPESEFEVEDDVDDGEDVAVAVDGKRVPIRLDCGFGRTCVLTVRGGSR
ncbi:MAG: hypothetical protein ACRDP8_24400 [Actinopolymorphaceae bacterium]